MASTMLNKYLSTSYFTFYYLIEYIIIAIFGIYNTLTGNVHSIKLIYYQWQEFIYYNKNSIYKPCILTFHC